jgi:hypothetical protein
LIDPRIAIHGLKKDLRVTYSPPVFMGLPRKFSAIMAPRENIVLNKSAAP